VRRFIVLDTIPVDAVDLLAFVVRRGSNEPCRICGETVTYEDTVLRGAVCAGVSRDGRTSSAHKACWERDVPRALWAYPHDKQAG
jgi:hypothetical protein